MNCKITTLVDNTVSMSGKELIGEHGLSFYIETGSHKILFDTGQNIALFHNARVLGIDLKRIDTVVLSHGHYDHTGGLKRLLEINSGFTLWSHPDVFGKKLKAEKEGYKKIGMPLGKTRLEKSGITLHLGEKAAEMTPGIMTSGEIPLKNDFEAPETRFFIKARQQVLPDTLADDQALILNSAKGLVALLGCSHRGVINTLDHVVSLTGKKKIHAILGGLHLEKASDAKLKKIIKHLRGFGLERVGVGHCTGYRAILALSNEFKDRVFLNTVGNVIEF